MNALSTQAGVPLSEVWLLSGGGGWLHLMGDETPQSSHTKRPAASRAMSENRCHKGSRCARVSGEPTRHDHGRPGPI